MPSIVQVAVGRVSTLSASAPGLLALADINPVALRTALTGSPSLLDILVICPGSHRQHDAPSLSKGEYPACANMTSGYVFRVENEATVHQMQRLGKAGHLTTLRVHSPSPPQARRNRGGAMVGDFCYLSAALLTVLSAMALRTLDDLGGLTFLGNFVLIRVINVLVLRRRALQGWKGAPEPGVRGDLLVLLSQDRWIRVQGYTDDIKAITSGQWLREMTGLESVLISCATLLAFVNAAVTCNTKEGQLVLIALLLASAGLVGLANWSMRSFAMYGKQLEVVGEPVAYARRLVLAERLIKESGREDWAIRLGMIQPRDSSIVAEHKLGPKIM